MATINTTPNGTEYLDHVCVFNGDNCEIIKNNAEAILDGVYGDKQALATALEATGMKIDTTKRISVEDSEMTQFHYFA